LVGADVLLLDEPTEHLDAAVADALLRDLVHAGSDRSADGPGPTVVVVTHRVSGVSGADEILVVGQGTVTSRGSHDHLLASSSGYRELWQNEHAALPEPAAQTGE
jgi:ATP-binding cassette subfamily C protein CydC